jgi:hypothetical protein
MRLKQTSISSCTSTRILCITQTSRQHDNTWMQSHTRIARLKYHILCMYAKQGGTQAQGMHTARNHSTHVIMSARCLVHEMDSSSIKHQRAPLSMAQSTWQCYPQFSSAPRGDDLLRSEAPISTWTTIRPSAASVRVHNALQLSPVSNGSCCDGVMRLTHAKVGLLAGQHTDVLNANVAQMRTDRDVIASIKSMHGNASAVRRNRMISRRVGGSEA